jgi:hypothetical protein
MASSAKLPRRADGTCFPMDSTFSDRFLAQIGAPGDADSALCQD